MGGGHSAAQVRRQERLCWHSQVLGRMLCGVREDRGQFVCGQPLALPLADHVTLL